MNIVELISSKVKGINLENTNPAVCISGGIDSSIVLHHVIHDLMDGDASGVHTFIATFGNDQDEKDKAKRVADYYGTVHKEISVSRSDIILMLTIALKRYPFPRFNIWTWNLVREIKKFNLSHLFIGEGGDELFGYPDRSFLEGWAGQLVWVSPAWEGACDYFDIKLHRPFMEIQDEWSPVIEYYVPPDKQKMRDGYKNILPDFVIEQASTPPSHGFYKMMGMSKEELQVMATEIWLEVHRGIDK